MHRRGRRRGGGVGTLVAGIGLIALALSAGWVGGAFYDSLRKPDCAGACTSQVLAADVTSDDSDSSASPQTAATPQPTATARTSEPDGFPFISAHSVAVIEGSCGALIYGREEHAPQPPASLTKLMTAAVAVEQADTETIITSRVDGWRMHDETLSTVMGLQPGMRLTLLDLLYGLLLPSGNDAAVAIAEGIGGTEARFVEMMNEKAQALALTDTHFTNPHGLNDERLRSSAYDMGMLARYVMQNAKLRRIVSTVSWQPAWDGPEVWNGNRFLTEYEGADGVKIGYTEESAQTIVASATREGRRIIASLMHSQDRYTDAQRLLDWAFAQPSSCP